MKVLREPAEKTAMSWPQSLKRLEVATTKNCGHWQTSNAQKSEFLQQMKSFHI
jgi:hypothetical protein